MIIGGPTEVWGFWAFYLGVATVLAVVVHLLRRRNLMIASRAVDRALRAATEDSATGLANRRGLGMLGREVVALSRRHNDAVHCSFVDVDGLKAVNDRFGHDAGDDVILAVAEALRRSARESDVVARWGGDEFVIVGLGAGVPPLDLERRVQSFLEGDEGLADHLSGIRISVGRSLLEPWDTGDLQGLLWSADRDMYVRRALKGRTVPPVVTIERSTDDDAQP
jgi:diguanylate cyclase (GGDEF)-like protein